MAQLGKDRLPHLIRCLTFVEGEIVAELNYLSLRTLRNLGVLAGNINRALSVRIGA